MSSILNIVHVDIIKFCIFPFVSSLDLAVSTRVSRIWKTYVTRYFNTRCWQGIESIFTTMQVDEFKVEFREKLKASIMSSTSIRELKKNGNQGLYLMLSLTSEHIKEHPFSQNLTERLRSLIAIEFAKLGLRKDALYIAKKVFAENLKEDTLSNIKIELGKLNINLILSQESRDFDQVDIIIAYYGRWNGKRKINLDCDLEQGFNFNSHSRKSLGFVSDLKIDDRELRRDLTVRLWEPEQVCGILSHFSAKRRFDPIVFQAQFSAQNRCEILNCIRCSMEDTVEQRRLFFINAQIPLIFHLTILSYDFRTQNYFNQIQCYIRGVIEEIKIADQSDKQHQILNYTCRFSVLVPQNIRE